MLLVRLVVVTLTTLALALTPVATAGTISVIVAGEPARQAEVEATLSPWLKAHGFIVEMGAAEPAVLTKLVDCFVLTDQSCAEAAVARLGADDTLFVMVEVAATPGTDAADVRLTGWLYGAGGQALVAQSVFCRACLDAAVRPTIEGLAASLFAAAAQGTGTLTVTSTPAGAQVRIDGRLVGVTPLEQVVRTGRLDVTVARPGYQRARRSVEIAKDATAALAVTLAPGAHRNPVWLGVTGVGDATAITGGVLVALDQDCVAAGPCDVPATARTYRDTGLLGAALVVGGVVAAGVGGYAYWLSGRGPAAEPVAWVAPGGGGVAVRGQF